MVFFIFSCWFFTIPFISALAFIISFLLLALGLVYSFLVS